MSDEIENGLNFKLNLKNRKLFAVISPCEDKIELTAKIVKERLEQSNFSDFFINDFLICDLVYRYNHSNNEILEIEIGEQRDASCEIVLSDDKMQALMTLTPNFGGVAMTLTAVKKCLLEKNIVWGIVSDIEIEEAIKQGEICEFVIAQGLEPVHGQDTQFVSLIDGVSSKKCQPLVNEDGIVDFRELGSTITIVNKDEVLMYRTPPVIGKEGKNVLGEVVLPSGGNDIAFSGDRKGVDLNPLDKNQLISMITGQPVLVPNGIIVLPVLTVKRVDLQSGNIRFNGSVIVTGDVKEGMKVHALEDITVEGNVFNAKLECLGNLTINGSVTGNSELLANGNVIIKGGMQGYSKSTNGEHGAKIITRGSVCAGFVENFTIEAGMDIVIDKYSMNNVLMAQNKIVVGNKSTGRKSSIIGGLTWAMTMVNAAIIGSSAGLKTRIQVGVNPYVQKRITEIKAALQANEKGQRDIQTVLTFLETNPKQDNEETLEKLHRTLSKLEIETETLQAELNELVSNLSVIDNAKVLATLGVYSGTEIQINNQQWKAEENRGKSAFRISKREISISTR
jgi:uncharacterized protein